METIDLELTKIFAKVVKYGSFSRAAEQLRIPKSTVSKAITQLEHNTGTKLLLRTTRSLTTTAAGRVYYDSVAPAIQTIEDAQKSLSGSDSILSGLVRITAPEDLGAAVISPAVAELAMRHSGLSFDLQYTDEVVDLVNDGFDLAIRIGKLKESSLKSKRIGDIALILVAAPSYLQKSKPIKHPDDLLKHKCLSISARKFEWPLKSDSESTTLTITPSITSNQMSSLLHAAIHGAGIALIPHYFAKPYLDSGVACRVLPQWSMRGLGVSMVSPLAFSSSVRLKATSDYLMTKVQGALRI